MPGSEDADVQPSKSEVMRDAHDRPYIVNANGDVEMLSMDNLPLITPRRGEVNLDRVLSLYKERAEAWQKGKEREELENFLRGDIMGDDRNLVGIKTGPMDVDTCIGMGLGTFTANLPSPECSTTQPMDRLVALLFMVKVLGEYNLSLLDSGLRHSYVTPQFMLDVRVVISVVSDAFSFFWFLFATLQLERHLR